MSVYLAQTISISVCEGFMVIFYLFNIMLISGIVDVVVMYQLLEPLNSYSKVQTTCTPVTS